MNSDAYRRATGSFVLLLCVMAGAANAFPIESAYEAQALHAASATLRFEFPAGGDAPGFALPVGLVASPTQEQELELPFSRFAGSVSPARGILVGDSAARSGLTFTLPRDPETGFPIMERLRQPASTGGITREIGGNIDLGGGGEVDVSEPPVSGGRIALSHGGGIGPTTNGGAPASLGALAVPEPDVLALLALGFASLLATLRRQNRP